MIWDEIDAAKKAAQERRDRFWNRAGGVGAILIICTMFCALGLGIRGAIRDQRERQEPVTKTVARKGSTPTWGGSVDWFVIADDRTYTDVPAEEWHQLEPGDKHTAQRQFWKHYEP